MNKDHSCTKTCTNAIIVLFWWTLHYISQRRSQTACISAAWLLSLETEIGCTELKSHILSLRQSKKYNKQQLTEPHSFCFICGRSQVWILALALYIPSTAASPVPPHIFCHTILNRLWQYILGSSCSTIIAILPFKYYISYAAVKASLNKPT